MRNNDDRIFMRKYVEYAVLIIKYTKILHKHTKNPVDIFSCTAHVECVIMMTNSGSKDK